MTRYIGSIKISKKNDTRTVLLITEEVLNSGARRNFTMMIRDLYPGYNIMRMSIHKAIKRNKR